MTGQDVPPEWRQAERDFADPVIGDTTISRLFAESARRNADTLAQRYKGGVHDRSLAGSVVEEPPAGTYGEITYTEMHEAVGHLAAGFRELGVRGDQRVAIYGDTRMEWALTDFALLAAGGVVTTVYTESSPSQVEYLLDDAGAEAAVVENDDCLDRVLDADVDLAFVVVMDESERAQAVDAAEGDGTPVYTLGAVHDRGAAAFDRADYERWLGRRDPGDLASLIYTSGTTGQPKGVKLTHRNFRANVNQVYRRLGPRPDKAADLPTLDADTRTISFLPLAHVFERLAGHFVMFAAGATVCYAESPDTLAEDIRQVSPNTGASVPRVYERIFDRMRERAGESGLKQRIFRWAVGVAREWTRTERPGPGLRARHALADRLVYSTLRENLGGELEFMVSGGGSLSEELCATFVGMGVPIVEGYGLTETAPVVSVNPPEDIRPGTMGVPVVDLETRLDAGPIDRSEFQTRAGGSIGELLVRGPNVSPGYWEKPGETERAYTDAVEGSSDAAADGGATDPTAGAADGRWFRTGDIVELTDDDYLIYHERLKQLIVLSTGKNVAPQPIEDEFATSDRVAQLMVVGDEEKFVGALVVPNFEQVRRFADREGLTLPDDEAAICEDERVREWIAEEIERVNADLGRIERIKDFRLVPEDWTAENDLLTPSMKKKRRNIRERYEDALADIYAEE